MKKNIHTVSNILHSASVKIISAAVSPSFFSALSAVIFLSVCAVYAVTPSAPPVPFISYNYGIWDKSVPAAPAYESEKSMNGADWNIGPLNNPKDLAKDKNGLIYVLDAGNKRIVVVNDDMEFVREIIPSSQDGTALNLSEPSGICFDKNGRLYIADRGQRRVVICDADGKHISSIIKPVSDLIDSKTEFLPDKVLVDGAGVLYVLSFGSYQGAYTFDADGDFLGFFGSNKVTVSQKLLSDRMWRFFATKEQRERMYRYVPVEYVNFAIDKDGFIYTVSNFGDNDQRGQVRKLNPLSQNILFAGQKPNLMFFGDWETVWTNRIEKSSLIAVDIDSRGFINVLDFERGRIFQYDQSCNLIAVFGGPGNQTGTFKNAADLISIGEKIYVLDNVKASLTSFVPTSYGQAVHRAVVLYEDGRYEQALEPWFEALKMDRNNHIILRGIGRSYERLERYKEAMDYYKQAQYHSSFSDAFREWRTNFLRKHFALFMLLIALLIALPFVLEYTKPYRRQKKTAAERTVFVSKYRFPFYLLLHPFKGWEELKYEKQGSLLFANSILAAWFVMSIVEYQATGFIFNHNRLDQMNLLINLASTIGIFVLWSVSNWGVCTLQDGKGTFREVWIFSAYSRLLPVLAAVPLVILSRLITAEEGFFYYALVSVVQIYSTVQLVLAVKAAHQYTLNKTIVSALLTLLGILLIILVILLFVSLFSQMMTFGSTIVREILMRL